MNKKLQKNLRLLAKTFPASCFEFKGSKGLKGVDLIALGVTKLPNGGAVEDERYYSQTTQSLENWNHYKKLKKYLKRHGQKDFFDIYCKEFAIHHARMMITYPENFKKLSTHEDSNNI